jgi:calcineurin-like phosphoesterase family protein
MKKRITCISDTHGKHKQITSHLPGGEILIHSGDISTMGYPREIKDFCKWFNGIEGYTNKIFIAGNHDWGFINHIDKVSDILEKYDGITYLQDDLYLAGQDETGYNDMIKIYGSPWQPEFHNWAFNLPRNGWELGQKWSDVPVDTDILITHGPAYGFVDKVIGRSENLGCELLADRIKTIKPKIHVCGHIHSGRGIIFNDGTLYINASVLDEQYNYTQKPFTIDFDFETNEWEVINY